MEKTIQEVLDAIGGAENISKCTNCMTRLRLTLKEDENVNRDKVKSIQGVFGLIEAEEQFQIILVPGKAKITADLLNSRYDFA